MVKVTFKRDKIGEIKNEVLDQVVNKNHPINNISYDLKKCSNHDWDLPYNAGYYCITNNADKFVVEQAMIDINDWIKIQASAIGMSNNENTFVKAAYGDTVQRVEEDVKNNNVNNIPAPVLELKPNTWPRELEDGDTVEYTPVQEGRSRAVGARNAGLEWLPIWVAIRRIRR